MFRRGLLALAVTTATATSGYAADMFAPAGSYKDGVAPVYNWTGIYAGFQAGGMWGEDNVSFPAVPSTTHVSVDGGAYGGFLSGQYQFYNNIVAGLEVGGVFSGAQASAFCFTGVNCSEKIEGVLDVVGRLGYAWGNFQPYVKGGYANTTSQSVISGYSDSHDHDGWIAGGGIDYAVTPSIIVGIDYSHVEADSVTFSGTLGSDVTRNIDESMDIVTARVSFKWVPPLK